MGYLRILFALACLAMLALGGLVLATHDSSAPRGAVFAGSSPDQIPPAPVESAPPYAVRFDAVGCAQVGAVTVNAGDALIVVNTGAIQLKLNDGPISLPAWPLAPQSWVHVRFGASGAYEITGTRYTCASRGYAAPHLRLTITVP